jgi:hypothetical protein
VSDYVLTITVYGGLAITDHYHGVT